MLWLGLPLILLGLAWIVGFIVAHRRAVGRAAAAQAWPTASGEMIEARLVEEESTDSDGNTGYVYYPLLRYRYEVAGTVHEGARLRFGSVRSASRARAEAWAAPYAAGAPVEVRYDPADPAESVLEAVKPNAGYLVAASVGLVFIGLGLFALA